MVRVAERSRRTDGHTGPGPALVPPSAEPRGSSPVPKGRRASCRRRLSYPPPGSQRRVGNHDRPPPRPRCVLYLTLALWPFRGHPSRHVLARRRDATTRPGRRTNFKMGKMAFLNSVSVGICRFGSGARESVPLASSCCPPGVPGASSTRRPGVRVTSGAPGDDKESGSRCRVPGEPGPFRRAANVAPPGAIRGVRLPLGRALGLTEGCVACRC